MFDPARMICVLHNKRTRSITLETHTLFIFCIVLLLSLTESGSYRGTFLLFSDVFPIFLPLFDYLFPVLDILFS